jgi:hypothetical protein
MAPVLIITNGVGFHAVTAVGMGTRDDRPLELEKGWSNRASRLEAIYVHDDRIGPYVRANLEVKGGQHGRLFLRMKPNLTDSEQWWSLTHLLFPVHAKVRVTFGELQNVARNSVAASVEGYREELVRRGVEEAKQGPIEYETWIERSETYLRRLLRKDVDVGVVENLAKKVSFSRYVGIIRIQAPFLDPVEVLVDTTSTERNIYAIAVLAETNKKPATKVAAGFIASYMDCSDRLIMPAA